MVTRSNAAQQRVVLARRLLANSAEILRQHWLLPQPDREGQLGNPADVLLTIAGRCVAGDAAAIAEARRLLTAGQPPVDLVADTAAWNVLLTSELARLQPCDELLGDIVPVSAAPYPLVAGLLERFPARQSRLFDDIDILSCQHLLGSLLPQYQAIRDLLPGARFQEIIGKPYSANPWAMHAFEEYGFPINRRSVDLPDRNDHREPYRIGTYGHLHRKVVDDAVKRFFNLMPEARRLSGAPILVIDDGGALIDAVGRAAAKCATTRPIVCIEQTQRGLHAAKPAKGYGLSGGFALVNVAQTLSKLVLESKLIASSVLENLESWLARLRVSESRAAWASDLRIGLIGFGSVGESIAAALKSLEVEPRLYDVNRNRLAAAKRQGYEVSLELSELLEQSNVIVAATGGSWLNQGNAMLLRDGVVLVSASSGDAEFHGLPSWKSSQVAILDSALPNAQFDTIHGEIRVQRSDDAQLLILNGGFPVNFNGAIDPIAPAQIQLTRALMLAGVLQAIGFEGGDHRSMAGETGLFYIEDALDMYLYEAYEAAEGADIKARGEDATA